MNIIDATAVGLLDALAAILLGLILAEGLVAASRMYDEILDNWSRYQ